MMRKEGGVDRKGKGVDKNQESSLGESQEDMEEDVGEDMTMDMSDAPIAGFHYVIKIR
jgi:hypothetical protein